MKTFSAVTMAVVLALAGGCTAFKAELAGKHMVPPTDSVATGEAVVVYNHSASTFHFTIQVSGLTDVTGARIHLGEKEEVGPAVVVLVDEFKPGPFGGTLGQGTFAPDAFVGPLKDRPIGDLVNAMREKRAYVNVTTKHYPDGAARGTLIPQY